MGTSTRRTLSKATVCITRRQIYCLTVVWSWVVATLGCTTTRSTRRTTLALLCKATSLRAWHSCRRRRPWTPSRERTSSRTGLNTTCSARSSANVTLDKVVLIPPGATTHSFDMHQRYIELSTNVTAPNQVTITVPALEDKAPRGVYMLWLVTNTGAVSDAKWVVLQ